MGIFGKRDRDKYPDGSGRDSDKDYDADDAGIESLGVNTGQAYCTECKTWYDATDDAQVNKHSH
jgi:hypothetical protein